VSPQWSRFGVTGLASTEGSRFGVEVNSFGVSREGFRPGKLPETSDFLIRPGPDQKVRLAQPSPDFS
jgi:hypothetical protein